eukprot:1409979-Rhodomonas_salina.1
MQLPRMGRLPLMPTRELMTSAESSCVRVNTLGTPGVRLTLASARPRLSRLDSTFLNSTNIWARGNERIYPDLLQPRSGTSTWLGSTRRWMTCFSVISLPEALCTDDVTLPSRRHFPEEDISCFCSASRTVPAARER